MRNARLIRSVTTLIAAAALFACSSAPEDTAASNEQAATADIDHMIRRPNGTFDVYCADGTSESGVSPERIVANDICKPPAPAQTCPSKTLPAAAWNPPPPASVVCTTEDVQFLQDAAQTATSLADLQVALVARNAACSTCVFAKPADATWGPIVLTDKLGDGFVNWGACFARAKGGNDACGAAFGKTYKCAQDICSACASPEELGACMGNAFQDPAMCGQYDVGTACGADFQTISQSCGTLWDSVRVVCGG